MLKEERHCVLQGAKDIWRVIMYRLFIAIAVLCVTSLYSMDQPDSMDSTESVFLLLKQIVEKDKDSFLLSMQDVSRLKRVSRMFSTCWNVKNIRLTFDECTQALRYYAEESNEKEFRYFWMQNSIERERALAELFCIDNFSTAECMQVYNGCFMVKRAEDIINQKRLRFALRERNIVLAKTILIGKRFPFFLEYKKNCTFLRRVCQMGDVSLLLALLGNNERINYTDSQGISVLHDAVWNGTAEMVQALLSRGARINVSDKQRQTPLHYAVRVGKVSTVRILCEKGANINAGDMWRDTPLHDAVYRGWYKVVDVLLECKGINVNACQGCQETPLHYAVRRGGKRLILSLLGKRADIYAQNFAGHTPFQIACCKGKFDIARILIEQDIALVNQTDNTQNTPLHLVSLITKNPHIRKPKMINLLLQYGADPSAINNEGKKALDMGTNEELH